MSNPQSSQDISPQDVSAPGTSANDAPTDYQPEQGSPEDTLGDAAIRQSSPLSDRQQNKSEEDLEEA